MRICLIAGVCLSLGVALQGAPPEPSPQAVTSVVQVDPRTGRLVRRVVSPKPAAGKPAVPNQVRQIVEETARAHDVDPLLVHSVIEVESGYNPFAVSHKGAEGLMQLIPATARRFGVENPFNVRENIEGGVRYLKYLKDLFQDDRLALAAYNAGEGAVARHGGVPPYAETTKYVEKVGKKYEQARSKSAETPAPPPKPAELEHRPIEQFVGPDGRIYLRTR